MPCFPQQQLQVIGHIPTAQHFLFRDTSNMADPLTVLPDLFF